MKWIAKWVLSVLLILSGCTSASTGNTETPTTTEATVLTNVESSVESDASNDLSDAELDDSVTLETLEYNVYEQALTDLGKDYLVENVATTFISKEYIEELAYNSESNIYFGYTLDEINDVFSGERYIFTLGEDGTTTVESMEIIEDVDWDTVMKNVLVGSGVILVCVTVSSVTYTSIPAVSMIFAVSAESGTIAAASGSLVGGLSAGIVEYVETGNLDKAISVGTLAASESFKIGAIVGTISGGVGEGIGLYGATWKGLTMNQAAIIQRETHWPLSIIKYLNNMNQYQILKDANVDFSKVNNFAALIRNIDLDQLDDYGRTNLQRMVQGLAPLDKDGIAYELHHLGQSSDSPLVILTRQEHMQGGNHKLWHYNDHNVSDNPSSNAEWNKIRQDFWKDMAKQLGG